MPSQGEGEGTVSVLPVPSCQHQDVCGTSCSLGLLGLLWIFQETAFAAQSQVGSLSNTSTRVQVPFLAAAFNLIDAVMN